MLSWEAQLYNQKGVYTGSSSPLLSKFLKKQQKKRAKFTTGDVSGGSLRSEQQYQYPNHPAEGTTVSSRKRPQAPTYIYGLTQIVIPLSVLNLSSVGKSIV